MLITTVLLGACAIYVLIYGSYYLAGGVLVLVAAGTYAYYKF